MGTENNKRSKRRDRETLLSTVAAHILCPQTCSLSPTLFSVPKPVLCPPTPNILCLQTRFPVESSLSPAEFTAAAATEWAKIWELGRVPEQKWPWSEFEGEPKGTKALLDGPKGA